MKFDKQTADRVVNDLSRVKSILLSGRSLGIHITADKDTIEALRQSDHPDVNEVVGNLLLNGPGRFVYVDGKADAEMLSTCMKIAEEQGRSTEHLQIVFEEHAFDDLVSRKEEA